MIRHQAECDYFHRFWLEVFFQPAQEEMIIFLFEIDFVFIDAAVVDVVITSCLEFDLSARHGSLLDTRSLKTPGVWFSGISARP
jgi:hypothetical protein